MEYTGFQKDSGEWVSASEVDVDQQEVGVLKADGTQVKAVKVDASDIDKRGESYVLSANPSIVVLGKAEKMSKSRGNVVNPDDVIAQFGADALRLRNVYGTARGGQAVEPRRRQWRSRFSIESARLYRTISIR